MMRIAAFCLLIALVQGATVTVGPDGDFTFSPANITIKVGDTVTWNWDSNNHNVVSGIITNTDGALSCTPDGNFSSGALENKGTTWSFTFNTTGSWPYYCAPHCKFGMIGKVDVTEDGSTAGGSGSSTTTTTSSAFTVLPAAMFAGSLAVVTLFL